MRFAQEIRGTLKKKRKDDDRKKRRRRVEKIFLSYSLRGGEGSFPASVRKRCPIKVISMINKYCTSSWVPLKVYTENFN